MGDCTVKRKGQAKLFLGACQLSNAPVSREKFYSALIYIKQGIVHSPGREKSLINLHQSKKKFFKKRENLDGLPNAGRVKLYEQIYSEMDSTRFGIKFREGMAFSLSSQIKLNLRAARMPFV